MAQATPTSTYNNSTDVNNAKGGNVWPMREALVGTTSYVASSHMPCATASCVEVVVTYAGVDHTSIELIADGSQDGSAWFQTPLQRGVTTSVAVGVTLASYRSATDLAIGYTVPTEGFRYLRVWIKYTGGSAAGTLAIDGYQGGQT